jgi:hypothetical protein
MVVPKERNFDVKLKDADDVTEKYNHSTFAAEKDSVVVFYFKSILFISISVLLVGYYDLYNVVYEEVLEVFNGSGSSGSTRLTR